ncbi:hypothetical protein NIES267_46120 [Calothrix parasitica NIES-267]|uniref:Uncharacterized protein n=1 Tax=Calothrix parasitica NIES-267 TaxID=1973488 RepID=A0A1Z4LVA7_9CYAN|nr:hypothetical protein NIES267_46120 [Calothrix parasitica NIES-267]
MNKKVLGLLAASAAVVGSAIFATPARAVQQEVEVNLTVDEVLFLRTFETVSLRISQGELGGAIDKDFVGTTDGTALIDVEQDTGVEEINPGDNVTKEVKELYAVYGNGDVDEDDVSVSITVSPGGDMLSNNAGRNEILAKMSVVGPLESERNVDDLNDDLDLDGTLLRIGGVELAFEFQEDDGTAITPQAGDYTGGRLTVEATTIGS